MMNFFIVTEKAQRPAGQRGFCFYCGQPVGGHHKPDCVLICKRVNVKLTVEYEIEVPANWNKHNIEFHRNEGSWCANNLIDELECLSRAKGCLCSVASYECGEDTSAPYLDES